MMNKLAPAALALAAVAGGAWWYSTQSGAPQGTPISPAEAQGSDVELDLERVPDMTLGDADAPIEVIEYASLTCPHCASFHENVLPQIQENYIEPGHVRFVHREVYFDRYGLWAAMLARCGGSESRYFGLLDLIYEEQGDWASHSDPADAAEALRAIGRQAGLSNDRLDACFGDGEQAQAMVAAYEHYAELHDVSATPSFVINGEKFSNMSYSEFADVLDARLDD